MNDQKPTLPTGARRETVPGASLAIAVALVYRLAAGARA